MSIEIGLIVTFQCTKTIQDYPLLRIPDSPSCPVSVYHCMVRLVPACPRYTLFLLPSSRGCTPLIKPRLVTEFRRLLLAVAGVADAASFRGHSFRRNAASWALNYGVPGELIQLYGHWASDTYKFRVKCSVENYLCSSASFWRSVS